MNPEKWPGMQALRHTLAVGLALLCGAVASAQDTRDPTRPPAAANAPEPGNPTAGQPAAPGVPEYSAVVMRNGKPYLVCKTGLCGVGQKVGEDTIERITESEVWLRNGKQIQKLQRFEGVQRRTVQP